MWVVQAQLFAAVGTFQALICQGGETLGVELICKLPSHEESQRNEGKREGKASADEKHGSKHHCKVPVIDAAGGAASVAQKPALEGAEKEDAYHVAHRVEQ